MRYLLDTNAVTALVKTDQGFWQHLRRHAPEDIVLSAIVAHEMFYGAYRGTRTERTLRQIDELPFACLDFTVEDARRAGEVRAALPPPGRRSGPTTC